jgi:hypothetical protein
MASDVVLLAAWTRRADTIPRQRPPATVRGFTWRAGQRHRPGLQYLLATGRMHGFESLAALSGRSGRSPRKRDA